MWYVFMYLLCSKTISAISATMTWVNVEIYFQKGEIFAYPKWVQALLLEDEVIFFFMHSLYDACAQYVMSQEWERV